MKFHRFPTTYAGYNNAKAWLQAMGLWEEAQELLGERIDDAFVVVYHANDIRGQEYEDEDEF